MAPNPPQLGWQDCLRPDSQEQAWLLRASSVQGASRLDGFRGVRGLGFRVSGFRVWAGPSFLRRSAEIL